jgi:hypothetical protein
LLLQHYHSRAESCTGVTFPLCRLSHFKNAAITRSERWRKRNLFDTGISTYYKCAKSQVVFNKTAGCSVAEELLSVQPFCPSWISACFTMEWWSMKQITKWNENEVFEDLGRNTDASKDRKNEACIRISKESHSCFGIRLSRPSLYVSLRPSAYPVVEIKIRPASTNWPVFVIIEFRQSTVYIQCFLRRTPIRELSN